MLGQRKEHSGTRQKLCSCSRWRGEVTVEAKTPKRSKCLELLERLIELVQRLIAPQRLYANRPSFHIDSAP